MRGLPRTSLILVMVTGLIVGPGLLPSIHAQQGDHAKARRRLLEGTELFRRILHDKKCEPLSEFKDLEEDPERSILIVLGNLESIASMKKCDLHTFVRTGGAVLAASDRPLRARVAGSDVVAAQLFKVAGVAISEYTLVCDETDLCYKKLRFCPYVIPILGSQPFLFQPPHLAAGTKPERKLFEVATNVPSMLKVERRPLPGGVRPLAQLPLSSQLEPPGRKTGGEVPPLFAVGGDLGAGRVLLLADHSVFINEMMLPTDNNNVEFTEECVNWLRGPDGKRNRVLFVEDGRIQTRFDIELKSVNLPIEEIARTIFERRNELLGDAERVVGRLEDENAFNRWLLNALSWIGLTPRRLLFLAVSFGAVALLLYFIYRGIRRRFRHEMTVPVLTQAVARGLPVEPVMEQRHAELLQQGNVWEPASMMARRWFVRLGLERTDTNEPAFEAKGSWWRRRKVVGRLRRLWRLACGRQRQRVTAPELWRLQRELDELRGDWERGGWRVGAGT